MFAKLSTLAVVLPLVSALTLNTPTGVSNGATITITWTGTTTDPTSFSIEMGNTVFHNTFAIANNVPTAQGSITIQMPQVPPGDGYTIEAVAPNDINTVFATSGDFSVGAESSASTSAASTSAATLASSASSGATTAPSVTATTPVSSILASTVTPASTTTASATPSNLGSSSSGAASFKLVGVAPAVALVLSAMAGAVMVF